MRLGVRGSRATRTRSVGVGEAGRLAVARRYAPTTGATSDESKTNDTLQLIHPHQQQARTAAEATTTEERSG